MQVTGLRTPLWPAAARQVVGNNGMTAAAGVLRPDSSVCGRGTRLVAGGSIAGRWPLARATASKVAGEVGTSAPSVAMGALRRYKSLSSHADKVRRPCGPIFRRCAVCIAAASLRLQQQRTGGF